MDKISNFSVAYLNASDLARTIAYYSINNTNVSLTEQISPVKVLTWTTVTLMFCFIGCLTNSVTIYAVWPRSRQKSGVNLLILHYLIANLIMILVHYPIRCYMVQARSSYGLTVSTQVCHVVQTGLSVTWLVLYWSDVGLAFNRCVALYLPHHYRSYSTTRKNAFQIAVMWTASLAVMLPFSFGIGGLIPQLPIGHCAIRATKSHYGNFYNGFTYMPHAINGVTTVAILWKIMSMSKTRVMDGPAGTAGHDNSARIRQRIVMAKMLVMIYIWSIAFTLPSGFIIGAYPQVFQQDPLANVWTQTAVVAQYAVTPCILLISNEKYRLKLRGLAVGPASANSRMMTVSAATGAARPITSTGGVGGEAISLNPSAASAKHSAVATTGVSDN